MSEQVPRTRKPFDWSKWLALYCAGSFAALGVDAAMNHHDVIHENPYSYTPLIFAPLAVIACLAMFTSVKWRAPLAWIFGFLGVAVGLAGTIFHNLGNIEDAHTKSVWLALLNAQFPVLAPAAFASTAALLLIIGIAIWWSRPKP